MGANGTIAAKLLAWFATAKREMPWRTTPTPYLCWLSEIMLQQTTFASALPYYERFLAKFPTVEALASAEESEVLKAWEGLGYYARARNLLKAARQICAGGQARWPQTAAEWGTVPGVGPYTAAALASVLAGERVPVVDGNVARVFARYWMLEDDFGKLPARQRLAERLRPELPKGTGPVKKGTGPSKKGTGPGDFNQAMMELGALVCTPKSPHCGVCPLREKCAAHEAGRETDYPRKPQKGSVPVRRRKSVLIRDAAGRVLLVQNREGGLLKGLWELPTIEEIGSFAHVFSHFRLEQTAFVSERTDVAFKDPALVPLTTATRKALALAASPGVSGGSLS